MRQSICRETGGGARWMCVGCALDSHLCRLADEVVLHPAGHQVHHITLDWAWRSCWDLMDLGSRESQLVALKLEGDGFTALT